MGNGKWEGTVVVDRGVGRSDVIGGWNAAAGEALLFQFFMVSSRKATLGTPYPGPWRYRQVMTDVVVVGRERNRKLDPGSKERHITLQAGGAAVYGTPCSHSGILCLSEACS